MNVCASADIFYLFIYFILIKRIVVLVVVVVVAALSFSTNIIMGLMLMNLDWGSAGVVFFMSVLF